MTGKEKKLKLFQLFSRNLEWVKAHEEIRFNPDFSDGYICPICFNVFFEEDLKNTTNNPLTLEDVPPASLGGKVMTLTCKSCNSKNGYELDAHLLNILLDEDSHTFLPFSHSKAIFEIGGNKVNGTFSLDQYGDATIRIEPRISNPDQYGEFVSRMSERSVTKYSPLFYPQRMSFEEWRTPTFNMNFKRLYKERNAEIALLRIAYLIAYSQFGYGFLMSSSLFKIREQILNPGKDILPKVFWLRYKFPKEMEGLNIISFPNELHSFLVIFNLKTKSKITQFAIVLPGPTKYANEIYDYIEHNLCVGDGGTKLDIIAEHIPPLDYLKNKELAFASNIYWQKYTDPNYRS